MIERPWTASDTALLIVIIIACLVMIYGFTHGGRR